MTVELSDGWDSPVVYQIDFFVEESLLVIEEEIIEEEVVVEEEPVSDDEVVEEEVQEDESVEEQTTPVEPKPEPVATV